MHFRLHSYLIRSVRAFFFFFGVVGGGGECSPPRFERPRDKKMLQVLKQDKSKGEKRGIWEIYLFFGLSKPSIVECLGKEDLCGWMSRCIKISNCIMLHCADDQFYCTFKSMFILMHIKFLLFFFFLN